MNAQKQLPDSPSSFGEFRFIVGGDGGLVRVPTCLLERGFLLQRKDSQGKGVLRVRRDPVSVSGKIPPFEVWNRVAMRSEGGLPAGFIPVLESGEDDGLPYYVSGIHEGEPLQNYIERVGPLPASEAFKLLSDFVNVLDSQDLFRPEQLAIALESVWILRPMQKGLPLRLGLGEYSFLSTQEPENKSVAGSCALLWSLLAGEWWDDRYPDPVRRLAEREDVSTLIVPADGSHLGWKDWRRQVENLALQSFGAPVQPLPEPISFFETLLIDATSSEPKCNVIAEVVQNAPPSEIPRRRSWTPQVAAALSVITAAIFLWKQPENCPAPVHASANSTRARTVTDLQGLTMSPDTLSDLKRSIESTAGLIVPSSPSVMRSSVEELGVTSSEFRAGDSEPLRFDIQELANFGASFDSFPAPVEESNQAPVLIKPSPPQPSDSTPAELREEAKRILAGRPGEEDRDIALDHLKFAADAGDAEAQYLLGEAYLMGRIVEKNQARGVAELQRAASQNYARAADLLGVCCVRGWGRSVDFEQAVAWFEKAVNQDHPGAHYNLGARYAQGQGVSKDPVKAASLFRKGADLGDSVSMMLLGRCYETGFGISQDESQAKLWHRKSALAGNQEAANWCRKHGVSLAVR